MSTLALMEQGVTLGADGELFVIERAGTAIQRVRMNDVDEVLVFGSVTLTPGAVAALLRRGTATVFLSARGRYRGRLEGPASKDVELRVTQFERMRNADFALGLARAIVEGKIANQRQVLLRSQREHRREDLAQPIAALRLLIGQIGEATSVDQVRGLEGRAAAVYFGAFGPCLRNPRFSFSTRSRRPPRDPVNALLSFGYTLLGIVMETAVRRAGLEPMLGAFHAPDYGRPSLVLDLIEEFRPVVVDTLALRLVNRREVADEDFEAVGRADEDAFAAEDEPATPALLPGVWLSESGRRVFFRAWGRRLREVVYYPLRGQRLMLEEIMRQQAYQTARLVRGEPGPYVPFVPR
jgi:CRISPR-associated protein Cas1